MWWTLGNHQPQGAPGRLLAALAAGDLGNPSPVLKRDAVLYYQASRRMTVAQRMENLEKIGFFRFVDQFANPIAALGKAIEVEREYHPNGDVSNSLIVLPEAFNIGGTYN